MFKIAALYKFVVVSDPQNVSDTLTQLCRKHNILGALIIAHEGVNGTLAGGNNDMDMFIKDMMAEICELSSIDEIKFSEATEAPFYRLRVRVKAEIVTMGCPAANPAIQKGTYVEPADWNDLINDPDIIVIDTRNSYEVEIGTFSRAVDPKTNIFREFPDFVDQNLDPEIHKKVAMFCTGGVRCEKASAYMLCKGFENVYHLKGGILKYLEVVPDTESLWSGECFVFDQRAAVCTGVMEGHYEFCRACRAPLTQQDKQNDPHYEDGVSCLHCYDLTSEKKKGSARERNLQVRLADERNLKHLGYHKGGPYSEVDTKHQNMGHTAIRIDDIAS